MARDASAADPGPDRPASFRAVLGIPKLARPGKPNARAGEDAVVDTEAPAGVEDVRPAEAVDAPAPVWTRPVVAARAGGPSFAPLFAAAAGGLGLPGASRPAVVGDGSSHHGTRHRRFFGSLVPMLDGNPAWSSVLAAALAGRTFAAGWAGYPAWIEWVGQGQVRVVIAALPARPAELGVAGADEPATSPAPVVSKTLAYLKNHQDPMTADG